MGGRAKRQRVRESPAERSVPAPRDFSKRRRWIVAAAIVLCTAAGVVILDRLSRLGDAGSADGPARQQGPAVSLKSPPIDSWQRPATPEQLVADARQVADHLLESFPDSPQALTLGGRIYYAFGDEAAANRCWDKCLEINPQFAATWHVTGEAAWEHGDYEKAAGYLRRAIDAEPQLQPKLAFMLADSLMNCGNFEEAVSVLEQVAEHGPLSGDTLFLLGHAYLQLGQYQEARDRFDAALVMDPQSSKVHFGLATVYARLGEQQEARKHREEYAKLKSQELDETSRLRASLRNADFADARPLAGKCYLNAGKIYALHGNFLQAEKYWLRAATVDPQNPEPRTLLEALYAEQGRREEAIRVQQDGDLGRPQPEGI